MIKRFLKGGTGIPQPAQLHNYINPILDEGAPTSTGRIMDANWLCGALSIPIKLQSPRSEYNHGWGTEFLNSRPIIASSHLTLHGIDKLLTTLIFDIKSRTSPLILGLDVKRHSNTFNIDYPSTITFRRPTDDCPRRFITYISTDEHGNDRIQLEIVENSHSTYSSLLSNTIGRTDMSIAKKIHRYTHATSSEIARIFEDAGKLTEKLSSACDQVVAARKICASSVRPVDRNKVSISHMNGEFNSKIQAYFTVAYVPEMKLNILNIFIHGNFVWGENHFHGAI